MGWVTKIFSTALGKGALALAGACLVLLALLFWERHVNAGLSESNGQLKADNAGQSRAIEELRRERARLDIALTQRELEYAEVSDELERVRQAARQAVQSDFDARVWSAARVPAAVRRVLDDQDGNAGADRDLAPAKSADHADPDSAVLVDEASSFAPDMSHDHDDHVDAMTMAVSFWADLGGGRSLSIPEGM